MKGKKRLLAMLFAVALMFSELGSSVTQAAGSTGAESTADGADKKAVLVDAAGEETVSVGAANAAAEPIVAEADKKISDVSFTKRGKTDVPDRTQTYYTSNSAYNPYNDQNGTGNCTWYAFGRAYEVMGTKPNLNGGDAYNWYNYNDGYERSQTPREGAIMCWDNNGGLGHVAFVEEIKDGVIYYSHSFYQSMYYDVWSMPVGQESTQGFSRNYGTFQGYIYLPLDHAPQGNLDGAEAKSDGTILVWGWAFDLDDVSAAVDIHIYIDGSTYIGKGVANSSRPDVNSVYGVGDMHGYDFSVNTDLRGEHTISVWAVDGTHSTKLGEKNVVISAFSPRTTAPEAGNPYYYSDINIYHKSGRSPGGVNCNSAGNCTWYAYGRAYEILGTAPAFSGVYAPWTLFTNGMSGYEKKTAAENPQPKQGALIFWEAEEYAHMAVVEEVHGDGTFTVSQSYFHEGAGQLFVREKITIGSESSAGSGSYGTFLGYIYLPIQDSVTESTYNHPAGTRGRMVEIAEGELGKSDGNRYGTSVDYSVKFYSWCAAQNGLDTNNVTDTKSTNGMIAFFQSTNRWHNRDTTAWSYNGATSTQVDDGYIPKPGDFAAIDNNGVGTDAPETAAMVASVNEADGYFECIEADNYAEGIQKTRYSLSNLHLISRSADENDKTYVVGFGVPDFTTEVERNSYVISDVVISNISSEGFDISCAVNIPAGKKLTKVQFPTWTDNNGQDDLANSWQTNNLCAGTVEGNKVTYHVKTSDHNNEQGNYACHIYVFCNDDMQYAYRTRVCIGKPEDNSVTQISQDEYNGHIYTVYENVNGEKLDWQEAAAFCQSLGGNLVSITTAEENEFVKKMVSEYGTDCWIGANNLTTDGKFIWCDGEEFSYTNWAEGQPDNDNGVEHYVHMEIAGTWNDHNSSMKMAFVCETIPELEPVAAPQANPQSGSELTAKDTISLSSANPKAVIYYTVDGTNPTEASAKYEAPLEAGKLIQNVASRDSNTVTVKVIAYAEGFKPSEIVTFTYIVKSNDSKVPVNDIQLNMTNTTISKGSSATLTATVTPDNATDKTVKWSSSDEKVATVDDKGVVKAIATGECTITAEAADESGIKATCNVKVLSADENQVLVTGLKLNMSTASIKKDATVALTATVTPDNATDKTVKWSSSDEKVATVDDKGVVKAIEAGECTITAEAVDGSGVKATCKVTVPNAENSQKDPTPVATDQNTLVAKQKVNMAAYFGKSYAKYMVDNKSYASVNGKGILTAKKPGKIKVTACNKEGKQWIPAETVELTIEKPILKEKTIAQTKPAVTFSGSENLLGVTVAPTAWTSSKPTVALVDAKTGKITTVGRGSTKITAIYGDGKQAAKYTFTVKVSIPVLSKKSATMQTGAVLGLKLKNTKLPVEWSSSNEKVATVENGKVTARTFGTATITAAVDGVDYICDITVTAPALKQQTIVLNTGKTSKLGWRNTKLKGDSLTWTSSNPGVAVVDKTGKVIAISGGTAVITSEAGGVTASCTVTVK